MNKIQFDLFKLHDEKIDDSPRKFIMASGKNLKTKLSKIIKSIQERGISRYKLFKMLEKDIKISDANAQRLVYLKREWYPLIYIKYLLKMVNRSQIEFQKYIEYLKPNQPPEKISKAVKKLNIDLCKIAGAHAADGTLYQNYISITDKYKSNVEKFKKWIESCFNTKLSNIIKVSNNQWTLPFHNKIISRYLIKFLGFPSGEKQHTVKEPSIIKKSPLKFRKAFALGALTFESGIGIKPQIEFCVSSKEFRDSLYDILRNSNIEVTSMKRKSSGYWRFWSNRLSKEEAKNWLSFFEPHTEKWYKLYEYIYGFQGKVKNYEDAKKIFKTLFPVQPSSKTSIEEILQIIKNHKETWRYSIEKEIDGMKSKWAHSIRHYIDILKEANVIKKEKRKFGKKRSFGSIIRDVYIYNPNVSSWKVPYRPWLINKVKYIN